MKKRLTRHQVRDALRLLGVLTYGPYLKVVRPGRKRKPKLNIYQEPPTTGERHAS